MRAEPWLARDRLLGALRAAPLDQKVLRGLAEAYTALGDLPAAGACWFLTDAEDTDPAADAALAALRACYRTAVGLAHAIQVRGQVTDYPAQAQNRLRNLQAELRELGWTWMPPTRPAPTVRARHPATGRRLVDACEGALWVTVAAVLAVANIGIYVMGMIAILRAIW